MSICYPCGRVVSGQSSPRRSRTRPTTAENQLDGNKYTHILDRPYRWESWAAPKAKDGKIDHNTALSGDDLPAFVNQKLFPYLHRFLDDQSEEAFPDAFEFVTMKMQEAAPGNQPPADDTESERSRKNDRRGKLNRRGSTGKNSNG